MSVLSEHITQPVQKIQDLGLWFWCSDLIRTNIQLLQVDHWIKNCWVVGDIETTLKNIATQIIYQYTPHKANNGMLSNYKFIYTPNRIRVLKYNGQTILDIEYCCKHNEETQKTLAESEHRYLGNSNMVGFYVSLAAGNPILD